MARALLHDALSRAEPIVAPPILPSEFANVLRQRVRQGRAQPEEARAMMAQFLQIPISLQTPVTLYDRSLVLADQHGLPAIYDAQYVALADLLGATFWTADQRLLRTLDGRLPFVRWIGDHPI